MSALRPLWRCPQCGAELAGRNMWHSCGTWDLEHHFQGVPDTIRALFDGFRAQVESCGPVTMIPQKTRIVFMVRVRFAGAIVRKRSLQIRLWLMHRVRGDDRLMAATEFNRGTWGHRFRITDPAQLDDGFHDLVREAYRIGCQEHLSR